MGKKKSWFSYVKRFFKPKSEEKSKNWRWLFERLSFRQYHPAIEPPQKALNEATQEQRKRAFAVAIATAAAAEEAVAAAHHAAEVVRLTNYPYELRLKNQHVAAMKIQSAYRGHLARKALSALKGLVKLQAVIRGELVRRTVIKTSRSMSTLLSKSQRKRVPTLLDYLNQGEKRNSLSQKEGITKSDELRLQWKSWDLSLVSKEGVEAMYLQKQEAVAKRERMKQYSFSHRERRNDQSLQEPMIHKENRKTSRFDQCLELEAHQNVEKEPFFDASRLKLRTTCKQEKLEDLNSSYSRPRRSFCHIKQKSIGDDESLPNSPVFPMYMSATESAKAKSRSLSTPKQRLRLCDTYSGEHSPYKLRLASWSSFNGEMTKSNKRNSISQHISSSLGTFN